MKPRVLACWVACAAMLAGCLEVEQHPGWIGGAFDGKPDQMPEQASFHGSRLAWNAAVSDRAQFQNEYLRTGPLEEERDANDDR